MLIGGVLSEFFSILADKEALDELDAQQLKEIVSALSNIEITTARGDYAVQQSIAQLKQLIRSEASARLELHNIHEAVKQSVGRYQVALSRGQRLLEDRLRFRQQTAAQTQEYRYKDMAFRIFRNDALQKYRAQFDLAAKYVYLAAKAYDYETGLLSTDALSGSPFLTDIVRARALGLIQNGQPITGGQQPTLADAMGRMGMNFNLVLKPQLGFNNPQTETNRFSLRTELLRILPGEDGDIAWKTALGLPYVSNSAQPAAAWETPNNWDVPGENGFGTVRIGTVENLLDIEEFRKFCIPPQPAHAEEPGIVITFPTTVNFGLNYFGWPLAGSAPGAGEDDWGGDSAYDSTHFATKIRSVGVWFSNYSNAGAGMANTPRVYLIPVGMDVLRSPIIRKTDIRAFRVVDQLLPVPFPIGASDIGDPAWIPAYDTVNGTAEQIRRFPSFRAYHDSGVMKPEEMSFDSRLVCRSVWNTEWMLIIPGRTLHSDPDLGIQRFIQNVTDIKLYFQTYAYSGESLKALQQANDEAAKAAEQHSEVIYLNE